MWMGHPSVIVLPFHGGSRRRRRDGCVRSVETHPSAELGLDEARDAV